MNTTEILKLALLVEKTTPSYNRLDLNKKLADALTDDWQARKKHDFVKYCLDLLDKHTNATK